MDLKPYTYLQLSKNTFVIKFNDDILITIENTTKEHVEKTTGLLNGAFMEGVLFGSFNKVELDNMLEKPAA